MKTFFKRWKVLKKDRETKGGENNGEIPRKMEKWFGH